MSHAIRPGIDAVAAEPALGRMRQGRPPQAPGMQEVATVLVGPGGLLQDGLITILEENGYGVLEAVGTVAELDPTLDPALVLLNEFGAQEIAGAAIPLLRTMLPRARIAILAEPTDAAILRHSLDMGVQACLDHLMRPAALIKSLNVVMRGNVVMPVEAVPHLSMRGDSLRYVRVAAPAAPQPSPTDSLTVREIEILGCLAAGLPNKLIARRLAIAEATVKIHVKNILRKMGVRNRTQAAIWMHRHGFTPAPDPADD